MKKAISLITISFMLMFLAGCTIVQPVQQPTPTETPEVKKENKRDPREKKQDRGSRVKNNVAEQKTNKTQTVKHFTGLKSGVPSNRTGERELVVADRLFPVLNTTEVRLKKKTSSPTEVSVIEDLSIKVSNLDFNHFATKDDSWLKPGQVITANSLIGGGRPFAVNTPRNSISLTTNLAGASKTSIPVINPGQSGELKQAEESLISQNARPSTPSFSFSFHKIYSREDMEIRLTGNFKSEFPSLSNACEIGTLSQNTYHFYMFEFRQNLFDIQSEVPSATYSIFKDQVTDMTKYLYVNKVEYGRKGIIVFRSKKTLKELGITAATNYNTGLSEAEMKKVYKELNKNKDVQIFARFYGGNTAQELVSMQGRVENRNIDDIFNYLKSEKPINHRLALPVSYTLRNMNNEVIGIKNNKTQTVTTVTPAPPPALYKLKVTLTDIQCIVAVDGGGSNPDDYELRQYIIFKVAGKEKKYISRNLKKFPDSNCGGNQLICGDERHQIHVKKNADVSKRNRKMIDNSLVFHITHEELINPQTVFQITTDLQEHTSGFLTLSAPPGMTSTRVKIKDVVEILYGVENLKATSNFPDPMIAKGVKFQSYGSDFLYLADIQKSTSMILEGPIVLNISGGKAAAWVQFELID